MKGQGTQFDLMQAGKTPAARFYDRIVFLYPLVDIFLKPQRSTLAAELKGLPPGRLLEIGVGKGSMMRHYEAHQVTGIDISPAMLRHAKMKARAGTELLLMNGEEMNFEAAHFDYIVMSHVLAVTSDPEKLLEEAYRVLKPGGRLFLLNHFTPGNGMRFLDRAFSPLASLFHFRSHFVAGTLQAMHRFQVEKEIAFGRLSYFKLLILRKP